MITSIKLVTLSQKTSCMLFGGNEDDGDIIASACDIYSLSTSWSAVEIPHLIFSTQNSYFVQ